MLFGFCERTAWQMHRYRSSLEQSSPPSWHTASAWWGFTTEADRQRLEVIIRRGKRTDLCSEDHPALAELVECVDDELFDKVLINSGHVLYSILPRETDSTYAFRRRRHNRELISKTTHLAQCSFIVRMLYKDYVLTSRPPTVLDWWTNFHCYYCIIL